MSDHSAQSPAMDRDTLFRSLSSWGTQFSPEMLQGTEALYAPLVKRPDAASVARDISYGEHERHRLDLFRPNAEEQAPVLLFVHGGGFVMGDKGSPDAPFYNNIGAWAAAAGVLGATMNYRLAPGHGWPAGGEDVARAAAWLKANAADYGGDPNRIFIMGQSAGATHVADAVANPEWRGDIAGAIMISGLYDIGRAERSNFQFAYFGKDDSNWDNCSTVDGMVASGVPCFYGVSEYDPPDFQNQAAWLVAAHVAAHGRWPELHWLKSHNHVSSVSQIGSPFDTLGPRIIEFLQTEK